MTSRKKPGVAFWATAVLVGPLLYVLSFGPACWILSRTHDTAFSYRQTWFRGAVQSLYMPITEIGSMDYGQHDRLPPIPRAISWYVNLGCPKGSFIFLVDGEAMRGEEFGMNWPLF